MYKSFVRFLASIIGQIISNQAVFDNIVRFKSRVGWNGKVFLTPEAIGLFFAVVQILINSKVQHGVNWKVYTELKSQRLCGKFEDGALFLLADKMSWYLVISKTPGTNKAYYYNFMRWIKFIRDHSYCEMPAQPVHISCFNSAVYLIKWAHKLVNYPGPTDNSFVLNIQESAQRIARKSVNRKDPVTSDIIIFIMEINSHNDLSF
ncbi:hypothetical protein KUTeg_022121 [Tegillarca granosa]|uniref:Uncharacterized protein n=1 Tax=Tegillarca granosa TaxID=220873 RepID=A0ABQ9E9P3_TEGGR|nr:hypothetical protein KUTeg_022121 [Tegillarca granosa]